MSLFERRIFTRQLQHGHAMFVCDDKAFLIEIKDVSKGGCQILRPRSWPFNIDQQGRIYIFGEAGPVPNYPAQIAWFREEFIGIEFVR